MVIINLRIRKGIRQGCILYTEILSNSIALYRPRSSKIGRGHVDYQRSVKYMGGTDQYTIRIAVLSNAQQ
jgi:hypothetical protein